MKIKSLILLLVSLFVLFSCDSGLKFDNPLDRNSDAYNPSDTEPDNDSGETDTVSEYDDDKTDTASTNDDENQNRDDSDSTNPTHDDADSVNDSGDSVPDESDSDDDSADSVSDDDSDSTDTTPDESDSTPDEDADTDTIPADPCNPDPCSNVANSTGACTVSGTSYSCGCNSGYFWNDGKCKRITLGNICTGQTKCYNNTEEITCPTSETADFYGQDAQYAKAGYCYPQSFTVKTVSGKNIVVDNNTGLMWQQTIPTDAYNWNDAVSYCNDSGYAGYNDWRLPTPQELLTIVDNSRYKPAIDTTYFPNTPSSYFWSSSTYVYSTFNAWGVSFSSGSVNSNFKLDTYYVRCVRGERLPNSSFVTTTANGDVIVTDTKTGLVWQKTYESGKTWQQALDYCADLTYAGYSDWRLPDKNELASLVNYERYSPASDFPDMPNQYFWSSSTYVIATSNAWYVFFDNGVVDDGSKTSTGYVRCVR